jgi:ArsR family transcriptional regulator, arsenate/arsenite/antimonite-responsive transcriptional repressor
MRTKGDRSSVMMPDAQFRAIGRALADPHRFAILQQVAATEGMPCASLQEHAVLSPATIYHHMKELSEAGLIDITRKGRDAYLFLLRPVLDAYLERLASL